MTYDRYHRSVDRIFGWGFGVLVCMTITLMQKDFAYFDLGLSIIVAFCMLVVTPLSLLFCFYVLEWIAESAADLLDYFSGW